MNCFFKMIELIGKSYKVSNGRFGALPKTTIKEFASEKEVKEEI